MEGCKFRVQEPNSSVCGKVESGVAGVTSLSLGFRGGEIRFRVCDL